MLLFVRLFVLRSLSCYKHDVGTLLWLNAEALERAPTPLFGRLVQCSTHGHSFARLTQYIYIYVCVCVCVCVCVYTLHVLTVHG